MARSSVTRDRILAEALAQASRVGLEGVSIGGLAQALGMSKSGLFAHFKSVEALQLAVLDRALEAFEARVVGPALAHAAPIARLDALVAGYLDWIEGDEPGPGCLFIGAIQEFDARPGVLRDRLVASQQRWRSLLATTAEAARADGDLPPALDTARFVFMVVGLALAHQQGCQLLGDPMSRRLAESAYAHLKGSP